MAQLRKEDDKWSWPAELATFDPQRWSSRAAWYLARAHAAPSKLVALREIRASLGKPAGCAGVVIVGPPAD